MPACMPEPRRTVRHDRDEPRPLAADARPEPPLDDVVVGLQPQVVRRHVPRRVLAQERGQRVHVVALERVDVAGEQRLVVGVERLDRAVPVTVLILGRVERGTRPLGALFPRRDARVEQLGDLAGPGGGPREGSGPRAASADESLERETNARRMDSRAIATSAGSPPVGTTTGSGIGSTQSASSSAGPSVASATDAGPMSIGRSAACGR